jgi:hypothetical protein
LKPSADHGASRSVSGVAAAAVRPKLQTPSEPKLEEPAASQQTQTHPSADDGPPFPLAEPGEYYIGLWSGLPNYGCPYCGYATLSGSDSVELHILAKVDQGNSKHLKALELVKES